MTTAIDTLNVRAKNVGAWLYARSAAGVSSRVLRSEEYTFAKGVYRFSDGVPVNEVFVLFQDNEAKIRMLP